LASVRAEQAAKKAASNAAAAERRKSLDLPEHEYKKEEMEGVHPVRVEREEWDGRG
jgi:hypothetical protein